MPHPLLEILSPRPRARSATVTLLFLVLATSCSRPMATAPQPSGTGIVSTGGDRAALPSISTSQTIDNVDQQIVIALSPGADPASVAAQYGAILLDVQEGFALLERAPDELKDVQIGLKNDTRVLSTEDNTLAMPAEARQKSWAFDDGMSNYGTFVRQSSIAGLGLATAHQAGRGNGVLVAVLDTGIDPTHPLFQGRIAGGRDLIDNDSDPTDVADGIDQNGDGRADGAYGHGTHVAGIIALAAPQAQLLPVRVLDAEGRGDVKSVAAGIRWAVNHGARVINLSLGLLRQSNAIELALTEAQAQGVVCIASAGNAGTEFPAEYPAASQRVIAVAASGPDSRPAAFTSYGPWVDLCAPGVAIRSAYPGGQYRLWSGTSMSAPFVSGTAALLIGLHTDWGLTPVMKRMALYTRPMTGIKSVQAGRLGSGVLDARGALDDDRPAADMTDRSGTASPRPAPKPRDGSTPGGDPTPRPNTRS